MEPPALAGAVPSADARPAPRWGHALFRRLFVPGVLALSAASWVFHEQGTRWLHATFPRLDFTSGVLFLVMVLLWCAEQVYPARAEWNYGLLSGEGHGWRRLGHDLVYLLFITQVTGLLIFLTSSEVEARLKSWGFGLGLPHGPWPTGAPWALRVLLVFLVMELSSYGLHRAAHRFRWLWRFHSTHHVVTELTALKALRTHPVDNVLFYVARYVPVLLLGAGAEEVTAVVYFGAILSLLAHSNLDVREGVLGLVVNFPRYHAVHHSAELEASRSNFGCHTILWDRVFGTFRTPSPEHSGELGVRPVGPRTLGQELLVPFFPILDPDEE